MSHGHSGKFLRRQCKIYLSVDRLGEQKVQKSSFFELSESPKSKIFPLVGTMVLPSLQTSRFELLGG